MPPFDPPDARPTTSWWTAPDFHAHMTAEQHRMRYSKFGANLYDAEKGDAIREGRSTKAPKEKPTR